MNFDKLEYGQYSSPENFDFAMLSNALKERIYPVVILTGPSGAGKDSIITEMAAMNGLMAERIIRHTSRPRGEFETEGFTYHFVTKLQFEAMVNESEFIEWGLYGQGYYGTSVDSINVLSENQGPLLVDLDLDAARVLKQFLGLGEVPFIDVMVVPTIKGMPVDNIEGVLSVIEKRIRDRNRGESDKEINGRLKRARNFLQRTLEVEHIIANEDGNLAGAVGQIIDLINLQVQARQLNM